MAQGFSISIPLQRDARDGFKMNKTYKQVVNQNLKMLLLTVPGERIMDPSFGVGVRRFLFEQDSPITYSNLSARIHKQVSKYLSYLELEDVEFFSQGTGYPNMPDNTVKIKISYTIKPIASSDTLELVVT